MESLKISKDDLLDRLRTNRQIAVSFDADRLKQHKADCKQRANERRDFLRELIKLPDADLAEMGRYDKALPEGAVCPMSKVDQFDRAIDWINNDARKLFTVHANETYGQLLTWTSTPSSSTVCKD